MNSYRKIYVLLILRHFVQYGCQAHAVVRLCFFTLGENISSFSVWKGYFWILFLKIMIIIHRIFSFSLIIVIKIRRKNARKFVYNPENIEIYIEKSKKIIKYINILMYPPLKSYYRVFHFLSEAGAHQW